SDSLGNTLADFLVSEASQEDQTEDWALVRLYGSLSASQRDALLHGSKLSLLNMTSTQQRTVAEMVFAQEVDQKADESVAMDAPVPDQRMRFRMYGLSGSLITEPTELLPNGLDGAITL